MRCAYCHEDEDDPAAVSKLRVRCPTCGTYVHSSCMRELGACPTLGCAQGRAPRRVTVAPAAAAPPARPASPRSMTPGYVVGSLVVGAFVGFGSAVLFGIAVGLVFLARELHRSADGLDVAAWLFAAMAALVHLVVGPALWTPTRTLGWGRRARHLFFIQAILAPVAFGVAAALVEPDHGKTNWPWVVLLTVVEPLLAGAIAALLLGRDDAEATREAQHAAGPVPRPVVVPREGPPPAVVVRARPAATEPPPAEPLPAAPEAEPRRDLA